MSSAEVVKTCDSSVISGITDAIQVAPGGADVVAGASSAARGLPSMVGAQPHATAKATTSTASRRVMALDTCREGGDATGS